MSDSCNPVRQCYAGGYGGIPAGIEDFVALQAFNGERHIFSKRLQRKAGGCRIRSRANARMCSLRAGSRMYSAGDFASIRASNNAPRCSRSACSNQGAAGISACSALQNDPREVFGSGDPINRFEEEMV